MKGKTTCPNCAEQFVVDLQDNNKKHQVTCPNCANKFDVVAKCDKEDGECVWEEHGEPRKTVLSSMKPKTNKPMVAAIILMCVFAVGVGTTVFSEAFIGSSMNIAKDIGLTGSIQINLINDTNSTIKDADVTWGSQEILEIINGTYYLEGVEPGFQTIRITKPGYKSQKVEVLITPFIGSEIELSLDEGTGSSEDISFDNIGCSIILAIFSAFALFAMIACLKRQNVDVAIAGSFFGIFSFGFFFVGSILSIVAFVIIIMSRDEFEDGKKGKIF